MARSTILDVVHLRALEAVNTECRLRVSRNLHASKGVLDNTGRYERRAPLGARRFASGRDDLEYRAARAKENFKECSRTAGDSVEYAYNALGELVRRKTEGVVDRHFLWDNGQLLALLDGSGNRIAEYAYLPSGEPLSYTTSGGTDYYHVDLRGNVVGLSTGTAAVQQTNYAPWGSVENQTGFTFDSTRLGWKGNVWEGGKTNLYYVRNRWYDPASREFISEDPIGIAGGMNTYSYAGNDPVNGSDSEGFSACEPGESGHWDEVWVDGFVNHFQGWQYHDCKSKQQPGDGELGGLTAPEEAPHGGGGKSPAPKKEGLAACVWRTAKANLDNFDETVDRWFSPVPAAAVNLVGKYGGGVLGRYGLIGSGLETSKNLKLFARLMLWKSAAVPDLAPLKVQGIKVGLAATGEQLTTAAFVGGVLTNFLTAQAVHYAFRGGLGLGSLIVGAYLCKYDPE